MQSNSNRAVIEWLHGLPGCYSGQDRAEVLERARQEFQAVSGFQVASPEFERELFATGYAIRPGGGSPDGRAVTWTLALPEVHAEAPG